MTKLKKGDIVIFAGYSGENDDPLLVVGERLIIHEVSDDGSYAAIPVDDNGDYATDDSGAVRNGDTVYPDEIMTVEEWQTKNSDASSEDTVDADAGDGQTEEVKEEKPAAAKKTTKSAGKKKGTTAAKKAEKQAAEPAADAEASEASEPAAEPASETDEKLPAEATSPSSEMTTVQALLEGKDALEAAKELVTRTEETEFALGGVLSYIQTNNLHETIGYGGKKGFEDYIEKELGVKYRKARYLINIYDYFKEMGIDETRLAAMGWSKAKELVGVATKEDFEDWATFAIDHTRDDLIEHIKSTKVDASDGATPTAKLTKMTFALYDDQAETVTRALDAAKAQAQTDSVSAALELICGEWSMNSDNNDVTVDDYIAVIQAKFGVTVQVVESGAQEEDEEENVEQSTS